MTPKERGDASKMRRMRRYRSGFQAETLAALAYRCSGHRVLAKRFRTPVGEIDLIAVRQGRVAFVEVKRRMSIEACEASITQDLRRRVRGAAAVWLGQNPNFHDHDVGFDIVFVVPWALPRVLKDAL